MSHDPHDPTLGGRPAEERALRAQGRRTVRRLLDAGRAAIAERGFPHLRVDDIADRAETSHGTFYLYFANKDDLLETLAREAAAALEELAERLPEIGADDVGRKSLRGWLEELDEVHRTHGPVLRAWLDGRTTEDGDREDLTAPVRRALAQRVHESGRDDLAADAVALALVAMFERSLERADDRVPRAAQLDALAAIAHRGAFG